MKKLVCLLLTVLMVFGVTACSGSDSQPQEEIKEWTREGFFSDENGNLVSIFKTDNEEEYPGWYVGCMVDEDMYGWYILQEGNSLHGDIVPDYMDGHYVVTVSEEGEDGILFEVEGGKTYHLKLTEIEEASIAVNINTEGLGQFTAVSDAEDAFVAKEPVSSMILSLYEPTVYTLTAVSVEDGEDWTFVKWMKNGEDYSTEAEITVEFDGSADFVAVFEYQAE
ncbi:MAG: hypothetical protein IKE50_02215 [Erysipelotrichaceae bacterium]|nr:hypothetical protein [Erysipelotrichaceae bacterium]